MKLNLKRILSLLLVICMLAAEVPASVFAANTTGSDSNTGTINDSESSSVQTMSDGDTNNVKVVYKLNESSYTAGLANGDLMQGVKLADTNNFWGFAHTTGASLTWNSPNRCAQIKYNAAGRGLYNALEIYVPVAGEYDLSLNYAKYKSGANVDVFVLRDAESFKSDNAYDKNKITQGINSATPADAADAETADSVNMGLVAGYDASCSALSYDTANLGKVYLEAGTHLIAFYGSTSFTFFAGASFFMSSITLTAGDGTDAAVMQLKASTALQTLMAGGTTQINASAYLSNPDLSGLSLTYKSSNDSVATVSSTGLVKAIGEGNATITVSAVLGEKTLKTKDVAITVNNPDLSGLKVVYNFKLAADATVSDITFADTHNFWAYKTGALVPTANGLQADLTAAEQYVALELNVPAKGTYKLSVDYSAAADGALADVYVIPASTKDITAALTNPVGEVNFYNATAKQAVATLGDVEITAGGKYLLVLKAKSQPTGSTGWKLYPDVVALTDGDAVVAMDTVVTAGAAAVDFRQSTKLSVKTFLSDPAVKDYNITFKALDKYLEVDKDGNVKVIAAEKTAVTAKVEVSVSAYGKPAGKVIFELPVNAFNGSGIQTVYRYFFTNYTYKDKTREKFTFENNRGFWAYKADNAPNSDIIMHTVYGISAQLNTVGEWVAFEIDVPKAGDYALSMNHLVYKDGGIGEIYILPGNTTDIEAALTNSNKIGEVNYYDPITTVEKFNDTQIGIAKFAAAGKYLLVCKVSAKGANGSGRGYQYIGTITMYGGDDLLPTEISASTSKSSIKVSDKIQVSANAYLTDAVLRTEGFKVESLTPQFATVDATGVVTGKAAGKAKIRVSITSGGKTIYDDIELEILPVSASGITVLYDYMTGLNHRQPIRDVDMATTNGFWSYYHDNNYADEATATDRLFYNYPHALEAQGLGINKYLALKINVPKKGDYQIKQEYRAYYNGGIADFFILPGNTAKDEIASALEGEEPIGQVDFYSPSLEDKTADFGIYNFPKAGEYLLVIKMVKIGGGNGTYVRVRKTEIIGGSEIIPMNLVANAPKNALKKSDSMQLDVKLYLSDYTYTTKGVTFTSSNTKIAKVSKNGVITAINSGKVKITAKASGVDPVIINLEVLPFNASGITLKFNTKNYLSQLTAIRDVKFKDTHDYWEYYADNVYASYEASVDNAAFIIHDVFGIQAKGIGNGQWFALKVKVPKKGDYLMSLDHHTLFNGGLVNIYVLPGDTAVEDIDGLVNGVNAVEKIGSVNMYSELGGLTQTHLGAVTFATAGEYLIVAKGAGKGEGGGQHTYFKSFNFYGGEDAAIMAMEVVSAKSSLKTGETVKLATTTYLSNGELGNYIYQYKSMNASAVVNRSGVVTGAKHGTAKIQVTAVTPNGNVVRTLSIPVVKTKPSGAQATYDMLSGMSMYDEVRKITYDDTLDTWKYFADGDIERVRDVDIHTSYGIRFQNSSTNHWLAIKIKVETPGDYLWTQTYGKYSDGSIAGLYVMPGNTKANDIPELLKTTPKTAEINFFQPGGKLSTVSEALGYVNFPKAGEYVIVYDPERVPDGGRTWHLYIGSIFLDGVNCLKTVAPELDSVDLNYGQTIRNKFTLRKLDGTIINPKDCTITYRSSDSFVASVDDTGLVKAVGHGTATIEITAYDGVESHTGSYTVNCTDNTGVKKAFVDISDELYVRETTIATLVLTMNSGNKIKLPVNETVIKVSDAKKLEILEGTVTAKAEGTATITVSGYFLGKKVSAKKTVKIISHAGKQEATYYTMEMRNNAQINITRYDWAQASRDKTVRSARMTLRGFETLYNLLPEEGLPRNRQIAYKGDSKIGYCRYCDANVVALYGASGVGGWDVDPIQHPWKLQCKDCLRWFPSNDFESFYKLGLDENGHFDYDKAWAENDKLIARGEKGYLVNEMYPEMGEGWGVDDGYGARVYTDGTKYHKLDLYDEAGEPINFVENSKIDTNKSATYIALYMYTLWPIIESKTKDLAMAYVYTGELAYARAGAAMLDRIADVLPDYNNRNFCKDVWMTTCGGTGWGSVQGSIDDCGLYWQISECADALYPALNDPTLLKMLSRMAADVGEKSDKSSSQKIWQNWRDNILIETWEAAQDGRMSGNYGQKQNAVATAAISLAEEPETGMMLEWIYKYDTKTDNRTSDGGNLENQLIDVIDRDGMGNENSINYNSWWPQNLYKMADAMAKYEGKEVYNPYAHPKFAQLFAGYPAMILSDSHSAQYGDSGGIASLDFIISTDMYLSGFVAMKDTVLGKRLAQTLYTLHGGDVSNLHYDIFTENPERLAVEISAYVNKHENKRSEILTGHGYVSLQDGFFADQPSMQSAWMYFGKTSGHGHPSALNLGIEAFGLNMAPDLGYPVNTGAEPSRINWSSATISHNTVVVDNADQVGVGVTQDPYIFDDSDYVKVMGVSAPDAYRQTQEYKRTVVMVKVDDDDTYYMDFFRVLGGNHHTYSFHSQSHGAMPMEGLNLEMQIDDKGQFVGTYAGKKVKFAELGDFPKGYSYMTKVRKDTDPESNKFVVDFAVTDYRGAISNNSNLHLRMTQITNFTPSEVAIVGGWVLDKKDNAAIVEQTDTLEYVLTQREGKKGQKLDSLFTTVFEPYRNDSNITSVEQVPVKVVSGKPGSTDTAVAVKVTQKSGRVDYVFYASNNEVTYRVADTFNVRGYVAVYSLNGKTGTEVYRYVADGDIIVEDTKEVSVYKGTVQNFSTELTMTNNFIDINIPSSAAADVVGKVIYVENGGGENGAYRIESAKPIKDGVRVYLGTVSLVKAMREKANPDGGYIYNIAKGQRFEIPMSHTQTDLDNETKLMFLQIKGHRMNEIFEPEVMDYTCFVPNEARTIDIQAIAAHKNATIKIENGATVYNSGEANEVTLGPGRNVLEVTVIAEDGMSSRSYFITVSRAQHVCYGGEANCQEKAVCADCERLYGEINVNNHKEVELWNGLVPTEEADGYSGDYYCVACHLLVTKGHVLKYQAPVNIVLILCIAAGVLLAGGATTALIIISKKKGKPADTNPEEDNAEPTEE